ncbi:dihydrofolate reductase family protein [soil metagenome]
MSKLTVYEMVSLDGFIADAAGDMSWAHKNDSEWNEFANENARGKGTLLFGRTTYEMMESFWPTDMAAKQMPVVAARMNSSSKIVFSRTIETPTWQNTRVVKGDLGAEVTKLKAEASADMTIMGSANVVAQLIEAGVVDQITLAVHPLVLGGGKSIFAGVTTRPRFRQTKTRTFKDGSIVLYFDRA